MRIKDIISEENFEFKKNSPKVDKIHDRYRKSGKWLGSGAYASVYKTKKVDVGHVAKVSTLDYLEDNGHEKDGYYQWINAVLKAPPNRYLPQVLKAAIHEPKIKSNSRYREHPYMDVKLERLYPVSQLTQEGIDFIANQIFLKQKKGWRINEILFRIHDHIEGAKNKQYRIVDEDLIEALSLIEKITGRNMPDSYDIDLHGENVMIRITPYGPQLVITDPLG
jgi:hypothetical protein